VRDEDHIPVLLKEVLGTLLPADGRADGTPGPYLAKTYVDCTAGLGGHAAAVAAGLAAGSVVVLNDLDEGNLVHASARVSAAAPGVRVVRRHGNFAGVARWMAEEGLAADLVLADLGFASPQVDDAERGMSFMRDGPLDMRFDVSAKEGRSTAADLVASLPEADLAQILYEWGEERHSRAVARRIVEARKSERIATTGRLAEIVREALRGKVPPRQVTGVDPATKTFQALRIAVNDEIGNLMGFLDSVEKGARAVRNGKEGWLRPGGAVCVITFHSLEDRPVKQAFAKLVEQGLAREGTPKGKAVSASDEEIQVNPRSRSAKMRCVRLTSGQIANGQSAK
jgi:16S rRNA (cytosine1402-N4)-methyltransferase